MKSLKCFKKVIFTSLLIALPIFANAAGDGGGAGPGGGNTNAIQFRELPRATLGQVIKVSKDANLVKIAKQILAKVNSNNVNVVMVDDKLYYLGGEVDALNYPEQNRIEVNQDRINKKTYTERLQLAIHEFAGLAQVPDVNNITSSQLSNSDIFSIRCTADMFLGSPENSPESAHTNLIPTEKRSGGRYNNDEIIGYEFLGKIHDVYISIIFAFEDKQSSRYKETQITYWESYPDHISNSISYGWAGQIWNTTDSIRYPGQRISIRCHDKSIVDPEDKYQPDYDSYK